MELYTKNARVWVDHPDSVWESATVTSDYQSGVLIVKLDHSNQIRQIKIKDEAFMPPLCNPSLLVGQHNLTSLFYLHEPAVLHNLKVRFCDLNAIYTYCGIALVAINPYCDLPIYGDETIMAYRGKAMGELAPHIFAISEEAYTKLESETRNQSIIVSGESGAGKTLSAKYAMRYFAAVGGNDRETQVERKVLASNPIMEAIGNAKTIRNDNSSRFGKFIEIHFDNHYKISGASMRTYLLEKSRVVYQSAGERNFHIFYQLCSARKHLPELQLDHQDSFQYLNQGGCPDIDGVDDHEQFLDTLNMLFTLGVTEDEQRDMFAVLACVLHLGNIELLPHDPDGRASGDGEGVYVSSNDKHLSVICELLGVSKPELSKWLTHRRIASAHEVIVSRMDEQRASLARDALAKRLYGELIAWLVRTINRVLHTGHAKKQFIGVLDIYGFEMFEINSFEQFCINYANEKLQQQFNSHVFKLEQDEYIKEEISWKMIDFYDNQPCIDLIEDRLGVLALLDEECRVPQGCDRSFVAKLRDKCAQYPHFRNPRFGESAFIIKHFADEVEYQSGSFVEKNRETVSDEQVECFKSATCCLIHTMFADGGTVASLTHPGKRATGKQTVGAQFRTSLSALMDTLSATTPHYVRCIKPNDNKMAFQFDPARAVNQLRACGVLETIRISAAGFPSRWLYQDFFARYSLLCLAKEVDYADIESTCRRILAKHLRDPDKFQFGATKIFFRAGQVAYLEKVRAELQRTYCVRVQSLVRGFTARRRYQRILRALSDIQAYAPGYLTRRRAEAVRRQGSATKIQKMVGGLQARTLGNLARKVYRNRRLLTADYFDCWGPTQFASVTCGIRMPLDTFLKTRKSNRHTAFDNVCNLERVHNPPPKSDAQLKQEHLKQQLAKWIEEKEKKKKEAASKKKKPFRAGRSKYVPPANATFKPPEIITLKKNVELQKVTAQNKTTYYNYVFEPVLPINPDPNAPGVTRSKTYTDPKSTGSKPNAQRPRAANSIYDAKTTCKYKFTQTNSSNIDMESSKVKKIATPKEKLQQKKASSSKVRVINSKQSSDSSGEKVNIRRRSFRKSIFPKTGPESTDNKTILPHNETSSTTTYSKEEYSEVTNSEDDFISDNSTVESPVLKTAASSHIHTLKAKMIPRSELSSEEKLRSPNSPVVITLFSTPRSPKDPMLTPEQLEKVTKISPRVALSRVEMKLKLNEGLMDGDTVKMESVTHFRKQLSCEFERMTAMCNDWDKIFQQTVLPEPVQEQVLSAVGQARLLLSQKLQQFASPADLHGFWDMQTSESAANFAIPGRSILKSTNKNVTKSSKKSSKTKDITEMVANRQHTNETEQVTDSGTSSMDVEKFEEKKPIQKSRKLTRETALDSDEKVETVVKTPRRSNRKPALPLI